MPQFHNPSLVSNLEPFFLRRGERVDSEAIEFEDVKIVSPAGGSVTVVYEKFGHSLSGSISIDSDGKLDISTPANDVQISPGSGSVVAGAADVSLGTREQRFLTTELVDIKAGIMVPVDTMSALPGSLVVAQSVTYLIHEVREYEIVIQVADAVLGAAAGSEGNFIRMEYGGDVEWMEILEHSDADPGLIYKAVDGGYEYEVTRDLAGVDPKYWREGDAVVNTGEAGDGFIEVHARGNLDGDDGPSVRVYQRPAAATYDQYPVHALLGNLIGAYGYVADTFGVGAGKETSDHIVIDPTNGIRFRDGANNVLAQLTSAEWTLGLSTDDHITIDATDGIRFLDGSGNVHAQLNAAVWTIGRPSLGGHITISSGELVLKKGLVETIVLEADGDVFIGSDLSAPATTFLSIFANAQTYNTESMSAGDLLIGDNSAGKSNVLYDHSAGRMIFRGEKTQNIYIDTDGSLVAGSVVIDSTGITADADDEVRFQISGTTVGVIGGNATGHAPQPGVKIITDGAFGSSFEVIVEENGSEVGAVVASSVGGDLYFFIDQGSTEVFGISSACNILLPTNVVSEVSGQVSLSVEAASGQSVNIFEIRADGGTDLVTVSKDGALYIDNSVDASVPLRVDASGSQSANVVEIRNSGGTAISAFTSNGLLSIDSGTAAAVALAVEGAAAQSANIAEIRVTGGTAISQFNSNGLLYIDSGTAAAVALRVDAAGSQSVNIVEVRTSAGTAISAFDANGLLSVDSGASGSVAFSVEGAGLQSVNIAEIRVSGGTAISQFTQNGLLYIDSGTAAAVALRVDAAGSQSANIFEIRTSGGTNLMAMGAGGSWYMPPMTSITSAASPYTPTASDFVVLCNTGGGSITIALPAASGQTGRVLVFKKTSASNTLTLDPNSTELIEGAGTFAWTQNLRVYMIMCDGSAWYIVSCKL